MAKNKRSDGKSSGGGKGMKYRSAISGRYVKASPEAKEFSRQFNKKYRDTLRDLSDR